MKSRSNLGSSTASRGPRTAILGVALAFLMASLAAAQTGAAELREGVVIDPQAGTIYVMSPEGGIDAVDLKSGNVLWHSDAAARPLSASGFGILAQAESPQLGSLRLVLLDRAGREIRAASAALPQGVKATVVDDLTNRFTARGAGVRAGDQSFVVAWTATSLPGRGALIADERAEPKTDVGLLAFAPASGVVTTLPPAPGALAGPQVAVPADQRVAAPGNQYFSAGGAYRLASVLRPGATESYEWTLFDANGSRLGSIAAPFPFARFYVADGLVVHEQPPGARREGEDVVEWPLSLRAVSLAGGSEQWSRPIRDTEYRGPFPP